MPVLGMHRAREDEFAHLVRATRPQLFARHEAEVAGDAREPVARRPRHHRRIGVHVGAAAEFPQACVRTRVQPPCRFSGRLEARECSRVAGRIEALVEEQLHRSEHDAAVDVVLALAPGIVADAHRTHAAIACEVPGLALVQLALEMDAVDRAEVAVGAGREVEQIAQVLFHAARRTEPVQRAHDEGGVAQPAVAVVPVAHGARRFRHRGRHRGDDRAGAFVLAKLERDRGSDHRLLPLGRDREKAHPVAPVVARRLERSLRVLRRRIHQRLVGTEHDVDFMIEQERQFVAQHRQRRVGGRAQHDVAEQVAHVVRSERALRAPLAIARERPQAQANARRTRDRSDAAQQAHRMEDAAMLLVARREVANLDRAAVGRLQAREQHRAVPEVTLLRADFAFQFDIEPALVADARRQQRTEHRVTVERGQAAPDDAATRIDQRADAAIADHAEVERGLSRLLRRRRRHASAPSARASNAASQASTAAGSGNAQSARVGRRSPTMIALPPSDRAASNACSSV